MKKYLYVPISLYNQLNLYHFPSTGAYGNITGMRNLYWGKEAYIIRCGAYAYNVDKTTFEKAYQITHKFKL